MCVAFLAATAENFVDTIALIVSPEQNVLIWPRKRTNPGLIWCDDGSSQAKVDLFMFHNDSSGPAPI